MRKIVIVIGMLAILALAADQAKGTHLDPCWAHHAGKHPQVLMDFNVPVIRPAPTFTPAGKFQTIDLALSNPGAMGEPSFPVVDAPLIADYQSTSCWNRQDKTLTYTTFMWRQACTGAWNGSWETWSATGPIWHDNGLNVDRFRMVDSTNTWIYVGWIDAPEAGPNGQSIIHQEVFKRPELESDKTLRGGDVGWSGWSGIPQGTPVCP